MDLATVIDLRGNGVAQLPDAAADIVERYRPAQPDPQATAVGQSIEGQAGAYESHRTAFASNIERRAFQIVHHYRLLPEYGCDGVGFNYIEMRVF
ncbi:hypothetical protein AA12717_2142 [Gluconacetobacter sacchari DSM 12717]|uniref:Uncharacterized protein n=1 Tax=Gluconacetobacter sacchari DSM 12717 TaxID=1307940 RepID=A0ABQ0P7Q5_9PROT|nr:hypothetical protein AA12717_2142 [Gluconacetobacter sacchari DSM 12717]